MPLNPSGFKPPRIFRNGHVQTLIPALFRRSDPSIYSRERIITPDDDFLDLDWIKTGSDNLVIICHGLEGSSYSTSVVSMAKHLSANGFDALVLNFRSCSGEMNKQLRFYHSGETVDLGFVIDKVIQENKYKEIHLLGFSLGGNVVLKYTGEQGANISKQIGKTIAISAPCHLESSAYYLNRWSAKIYLNNFLRSLEKKIIIKHQLMPDKLSIKGMDQIKTFHDFDNRYTGPMHGFKDAHEYYTNSSSLFYLEQIKIPTLIINAQNDPFLARECYPIQVAENHNFVNLEMPESGGHVGFFEGKINGVYWTERRALAFFGNEQ